MGALFQGFAYRTYYTDLSARGLDRATIDKSVDVLLAWLKTNSRDVASQFGITVRQLDIVIGHYQDAYTAGVSSVLWIGAAVIAVGAVLAWFTFQQKQNKQPSRHASDKKQTGTKPLLTLPVR
jgi:hypothetical protein